MFLLLLVCSFELSDTLYQMTRLTPIRVFCTFTSSQKIFTSRSYKSLNGTWRKNQQAPKSAWSWQLILNKEPCKKRNAQTLKRYFAERRKNWSRTYRRHNFPLRNNGFLILFVTRGPVKAVLFLTQQPFQLRKCWCLT